MSIPPYGLAEEGEKNFYSYQKTLASFTTKKGRGGKAQLFLEESLKREKVFDINPVCQWAEEEGRLPKARFDYTKKGEERGVPRGEGRSYKGAQKTSSTSQGKGGPPLIGGKEGRRSPEKEGGDTVYRGSSHGDGSKKGELAQKVSKKVPQKEMGGTFLRNRLYQRKTI